MGVCPAATATAAIFTALIVLDIVNKNYNNILLHVSGGVFSVLGIFVLCNALGDIAGWAFLLIPFIVLLVGFLLIWIDSQKDTPVAPQVESPVVCSGCGYMPCTCPYSMTASLCQQYTTSPIQKPDTPALPPAVTSVPPRKIESTLGCPAKKA